MSGSIERESLDLDYHLGKEKAKKKAVYKLCSDRIMSKIVENNGRRHSKGILDDLKIFNQNVKIQNQNRILGRMSAEGLMLKGRE